jgi:hypothetical protein
MLCRSYHPTVFSHLNVDLIHSEQVHLSEPREAPGTGRGADPPFDGWSQMVPNEGNARHVLRLNTQIRTVLQTRTMLKGFFPQRVGVVPTGATHPSAETVQTSTLLLNDEFFFWNSPVRKAKL